MCGHRDEICVYFPNKGKNFVGLSAESHTDLHVGGDWLQPARYALQIIDQFSLDVLSFFPYAGIR
jgi:hypothetical protein